MNHYVNRLAVKMATRGSFMKEKLKEKLKDNSGNWLEESMKYIAAVVVGLIVIAALIALFKDTALPELKKKVLEAFNFS